MTKKKKSDIEAVRAAMRSVIGKRARRKSTGTSNPFRALTGKSWSSRSPLRWLA